MMNIIKKKGILRILNFTNLAQKEMLLIEYGKVQLSFNIVCNELIHPSVLMKVYIFKYKIPNIDIYKCKEYPRHNLILFKYSCYIIRNVDSLLLRSFLMILDGQ